MVEWKGFDTREEAERYAEKHGGTVCYENHSKRDPKMLAGVGIIYRYLQLDGLKQPYAVAKSTFS